MEVVRIVPVDLVGRELYEDSIGREPPCGFQHMQRSQRIYAEVLDYAAFVPLLYLYYGPVVRRLRGGMYDGIEGPVFPVYLQYAGKVRDIDREVLEVRIFGQRLDERRCVALAAKEVLPGIVVD